LFVVAALNCPSIKQCLAGGDNIVRSPGVDGPWTSIKVPTGTVLVKDISCSTPSHCVAVAQRNQADIALVSANGGRSWEDNPVPSLHIDLFGVSCINVERCIGVGAGVPSKFIRTSDGGASWSYTASATGYLTKIDCPTATRCLASGSATPTGPGLIEVSNDGGSTWHDVSSAGLDPISDVTCWSTKGCAAVGQNVQVKGMMAVTTDGGMTWRQESLPSGIEQVSWADCSSYGSCLLAVNTGKAPHTEGDIVRINVTHSR
jgi:photosystem II stability/assembly factor-like uncharacterized protein